MHSAMDFLLRHGYIVIFVAVFIEQIGLPIPSGPVLLAAGALAGFHRLNLAPVLVLALTASLICDSLWFALGRRRGGSVLKFVCRVSIEPDTCVSKTHSAYLRYGPESLLISKFLPWFGTLGPPLAGMFNLAIWKFLLTRCRRRSAVGGSVCRIRLAVPAATGGCRRRVVQIRRHHRIRAGRGRSGVSDFQIGPPVAALPRLPDASHHPWRTQAAHGRGRAVGGSGSAGRPREAGGMHSRRHGGGVPGPGFSAAVIGTKDVVFYCSCPEEISSVRAALRLKRHGLTRLHALQGGFSGWRALGFPVDGPRSRVARA